MIGCPRQQSLVLATVTQVGSESCNLSNAMTPSEVYFCRAFSGEASPGLMRKEPLRGQGTDEGGLALPSAAGKATAPPFPAPDGSHSPAGCPGRVGEGHSAWPSSSERGLGRHVASWD